MNATSLLAFIRIPGNAVAFRIRRMIRWSRGTVELRQESKDDLFAYLTDDRLEAEARASELEERYNLAPLAALSTRSLYRKNLYLLDSLEKATNGLPLPFEDGSGITALDVGSQDWYYVFALERWLRKHNRSPDIPVNLTGIEIDAYEMCGGFRSRIDYAQAYVKQTGNRHVRYLVGDFLQWQELGHNILFIFYPLMLRYQQLLWGLPLSCFNPQRMVENAAASIRPGGWLVVFCHSLPEHRRFLDVCHDNGSFTLLREGEAFSVLVDYHAATRDRRFSIWVRRYA